MKNLTYKNTVNGNCRAYYKDGKRLLCFQASGSKDFDLYECEPSGEPSHTIDHTPYIAGSPLPTGETITDKLLRKWLIRQVFKDVHDRANAYFQAHGWSTSEFDMSINDLSREVVQRYKDTFGTCYLVKVNLRGEERGVRDQIAKEWDGGTVLNFAAEFVTPIITDEVIDLILQRDLEYLPKDDFQRVEKIFDMLEDLGAMTLHWS